MALDNLHTYDDTRSYTSDRDNFIARKEKPNLFENGINGGIFNDGRGFPTIGYGYDLALDTRSFGIPGT